MEIVGGFMVMMSIISLFLAVVWLIMPFVVFAIKGKQDRTLEVLEAIEKRLAVLEAGLGPAGPERIQTGNNDGPVESSGTPSNEQPVGIAAVEMEPADEKIDQEASPAV